MKQLIDLTLPEWAWLNGGEHERGGDPLEGRNVVLHVRSASVIEFFLEDDFVAAGDNVQTYAFDFENPIGLVESHVAVLHYSAAVEDKHTLHEILVAAAKWYCNYMTWEDSNIIDDEMAALN